MRKFFLISFLFTSYIMLAQTDRSQIPQPGTPPVINLGEPATFHLPNGLTLLVVENHKLPKVSVSFKLDIPPIDQGDKAGISALTSALLGEGTQNIDKDTFNEEIDFLGAKLSLSVNSGYATSLTRFFPRVMELFADASLRPNFTQEELDKARAKLIQSLKADRKNTAKIAQRVGNILVYTPKHPYGNLMTEESLKRISLEDVQSFYRQHFTPSSAYMVILGDIKVQEAKELAEKYFLEWLPAKALETSIYNPRDAQYTRVDFVDVPNAVQSEIRAYNLENLKMNSADYFPALIMNYILGGGFGSYINLNLREQHGYTYGASSSLSANKWTEGTFSVATKVRNEVTAAAVDEILKEILRIQTQNVTEQKLQEAKARYLGSFIMSTENPMTIADFAIRIQTQNLPANFYKDFAKSLNAVTVEDVKRVANKYVKSGHLRFVIAGQKQTVAPELEKLTFKGKALPVFYFDKDGNPQK